MSRFTQILIALCTALVLQGCLTSLVTVPAGIVYGTGKLAVKGTAAAVRAVIPDSEEQKKCKEDRKADPRINCD